MKNAVKKILVNLLMPVCIFMQVMVLLPHHHHESTGVPCINMFHCVGEASHTGCGDHGCCSHETDHRHDAADEDCGFVIYDVIQPVSDKSLHIECFVAQLPGSWIDIAEWGINIISNVAVRNTPGIYSGESLRGEIPDHSDYIAAALPPRAPSFTA